MDNNEATKKYTEHDSGRYLWVVSIFRKIEYFVIQKWVTLPVRSVEVGTTKPSGNVACRGTPVDRVGEKSVFIKELIRSSFCCCADNSRIEESPHDATRMAKTGTKRRGNEEESRNAIERLKT